MKKLLTVLVITMLFCAAAYAADFVKVGDTVVSTNGDKSDSAEIVNVCPSFNRMYWNGDYAYTFSTGSDRSKKEKADTFYAIRIPADSTPKYVAYYWDRGSSNCQLIFTDGNDKCLAVLPSSKDGGYFRLPDTFCDGQGDHIFKAKVVYCGNTGKIHIGVGPVIASQTPPSTPGLPWWYTREFQSDK